MQSANDDQRRPGRKSTGGVEYRAKAWWGRFTDSRGQRFRLRLGTWPNSPQGEARAIDSLDEKDIMRGLSFPRRGQEAREETNDQTTIREHHFSFPSAPAISAINAAATGSGSFVLRASRMVAM